MKEVAQGHVMRFYPFIHRTHKHSDPAINSSKTIKQIRSLKAIEKRILSEFSFSFQCNLILKKTRYSGNFCTQNAHILSNSCTSDRLKTVAKVIRLCFNLFDF